tara:strand:- start:156 stop:1664 length:1509 start_codon:yes stop_codon:yes gene_type:complete
MFKVDYNPDVLSCLANLSNDEVFTPPSLANQVLDLLPNEMWSDKNITFLDPVSKSGVFLREITKRLLEGLKDEIPNRQERINHILKNQVFGIAITELTALLSRRSLYCTKNANSEYSICDEFESGSGNIYFKQIKHTWINGKCEFCKANKEVHDREEILESHAYMFIHRNIKEIYNMKFDVIIGNPPYQLDTGGSGRQAKPIYHLFIEKAKKLNPKYISMIIPARWYSGGFGLDKFRKSMLNDNRISEMFDFENSRDVFPGVDVAGGICYFLWDKDYNGNCNFFSNSGETTTKISRELNEFDIFIRQSKSIPIIRKIISNNNKFLNDTVSSIKPFGLASNYIPTKDGVPCWFIQKIGRKYVNKNDMNDKNNLLNKWKLLIPKAPIAGQTDFSKPIRFYHNKNAFIAKPGECCTESWIVACAFDTEKEVESFKSYLFTKIVRFLILQTVISQDVNKKNFSFVPKLDKYDKVFTDEILCKKWNISSNEWEYIDSKILPTTMNNE